MWMNIFIFQIATMTNIFTSILFCGTLLVLCSYGNGLRISSNKLNVPHNLYYGYCTRDNNTLPIFTQVIIMENHEIGEVPPKATSTSGRLFGWIPKFSSRQHSKLNKKRINTTIVYPPCVSSFLSSLQ